MAQCWMGHLGRSGQRHVLCLGYAMDLLSVIVADEFLESDSVAHMAEEVKDAATIVPRSMIWSYLLYVPFTLGMVI